MKILSMPAGTAAKTYIFNEGELSLSIRGNNGAYIRENANYTTGLTIGATIATPSPFPSGKYYALCVLESMDYTDYSTLKVKYRSTTAAAYVGFTSQASGEIATGLTKFDLAATSGATVNYTINIESITGVKYFVIYSGSGAGLSIDSIELVK